jgi:hypothetical protein
MADVPADPTVRDIPPGTFWAKNAADQWVIQRRSNGEQLAARADLRKAIIDAYKALATPGATP